ncbi:hypothetical protein [Mesorhizobium amorphae]|uniref:hypothetical protein n=1 Tax=Mesorhizobium amorphae TaxID=71433 RepID=UPI00391F5D6F
MKLRLVPMTLAKVAGIWMNLSLSRGPASSSRTRLPAVTSRLATVQPADPAPATM